MAERSSSGAHDRLSDCLEHGVVSSDAVYMPHSKQPFRGRRGRGKSSGNYRHDPQRQQQNDSLGRSESDGANQSGAHSKYGSGGRGQKPGHRGQYYGRRNVHNAVYGSRQLPESGEALFGDNSYYSESSVPDRVASPDTYNGVSHSRFDVMAHNVSLFHPREYVENSRVMRNVHDDHRYKDRGPRHVGDQQRGRRGRYGYSRGRGYKDASNYFSDEKLAAVNTQVAASFHSSDSKDAVARYEAPSEADFHSTTEFTNSDHKNFHSRARSGRKPMPDSENSTVRDDKLTLQGPSTASHDGILDDVQLHDLHISNVHSNVPSKMHGEAVFSAKIKKSDPEFETQRGSCSSLITFYVLVLFVEEYCAFTLLQLVLL